MGSFTNSISKFADKARIDTSKVCAKIARDTFRMAVNLTPSPSNSAPYSTGLLVNNWFVGYGVIKEGTRGKDATGSESRADLESIPDNAFTKVNAVYFTNTVSYAYRADMVGWPAGGGPTGRWKGAAPYHFVSTSILTISAIYK